MQRAPVAAVVIAYHPPAAILQNIAALAAQVSHVVVVDNTPSSKASDVLRELERDRACTVIRNGKNLGIAAGLNIGIRHAIAQGFSWILTLDQDSRVSDKYVEAMMAGYEEAAGHSRVGMLCPLYLDSRLNIEIPKLRGSDGNITGCLTSGSMIQAAVFELLGPFEEPLFIDYVDYEYCMRMRLMGFKIIGCRDAVLLHSLGHITLHRILGRELPVTNHNPKRRYYIHRNRLVLIRRYLASDKDWAITELKALVLDSMMVLWAEDKKIAKAGYMLRALYDGMLNRLGQRVPL